MLSSEPNRSCEKKPPHSLPRSQEDSGMLNPCLRRGCRIPAQYPLRQFLVESSVGGRRLQRDGTLPKANSTARNRQGARTPHSSEASMLPIYFHQNVLGKIVLEIRTGRSLQEVGLRGMRCLRMASALCRICPASYRAGFSRSLLSRSEKYVAISGNSL